jgi:hypothetical protein
VRPPAWFMASQAFRSAPRSNWKLFSRGWDREVPLCGTRSGESARTGKALTARSFVDQATRTLGVTNAR